MKTLYATLVDRKWLNICQVYIDAMLPFELPSKPKVFNVVADVLEWCIAKDGEEILYHYLDDFVEHLFLLQVCMGN